MIDAVAAAVKVKHAARGERYARLLMPYATVSTPSLERNSTMSVYHTTSREHDAIETKVKTAGAAG